MTADILTKFAEEALKPASGALEAVLAPKLDRLRNWAHERDVDARVLSTRTESLLAGYLRRVVRRVAGITTIVFPQQVLPLPLVYEPLVTIQRYNRKDHRPTRIRAPGARTFIIDNAGMGKSTYVKHVVLSEIHESDRIPILLELRRVPSNATLLDAIVAEIDAFDRALDREVLLRLIVSGRFLIVLDGFDEIPLAERTVRAREIEELALKGDHATIILTSRPELELPSMPDAQVITFRPLTKVQATSLIRRYDRASNLDVGDRLLTQIDAVPERFLETPLLVALLYRTYGYNGAISTRVTSFYDEIYTALYKGHDLSKAGFNREKASNLDVEEFRHLLRGFCFLLVSRQVDSLPSDSAAVSIIEEASALTNVISSTPSAFLADLLLPVPLMVRDGGELRFAHKTLAEYFAAEFLARSSKGFDLVGAIQSGPLRERFTESLNYLAELNPGMFASAVVAPLAQNVLASERVSADPIADTILFLAPQTKISVWRQKDVVSGKQDKNINIPRPRGGYTSTLYFYGLFRGEAHIVAIAPDPHSRVVASEAWAQVTNEISCDAGKHVDYEFNLLPMLLPLGSWVPFRNSDLLQDQVLKEIRDVLATALDAIGPSGRRYNPDSRSALVLSAERSEQRLAEVRKQEDKDRWLSDMLRAAGSDPVTKRPSRRRR